MDFSLSSEQNDIARAVRDYVMSLRNDGGRARGVDAPKGYEETAWKTMAGELGLASILVPERYQGLGLAAVDVVAVCEQLGAAVIPSPFLASAVHAVATLVATGDDDAMARWLPRIGAGEVVGCVAIQEQADDYRCAVPATSLGGGPRQLVVNGVKRFVLDAAAADVMIVLCRQGDATVLVEVDPAGPGVFVSSDESLDPTIRLATVTFVDAPALLLVGDGRAAADAGLDMLVLAQAAESLGGCGACLDMSVEYAKVRQQFGRPIGSFQAIKHKCADVYIALETARTAVWVAAWALDHDPEQASTALPTAAAEAGRAFAFAATENVQIHGGIGFTWEHEAHWYFKRARASEVLLGTVDEHYRRVLGCVTPAVQPSLS
jgi:alkylation response protein AidB-like acyl-CoA dehydrogenase